MNDPLYWSTRIALVAMWIVVGVVAWRQRLRGGASAALVYASLRVRPWNFELLESGRAGLRGLGVYDDRIVPKIALAVVVAVTVVVVLLRRARSAGRATHLSWLAFLALLLQGLLLLSETISLDDFLPRWLMAQPGRYVYEGTMATLALVGLRPRRDGIR